MPSNGVTRSPWAKSTCRLSASPDYISHNAERSGPCPRSWRGKGGREAERKRGAESPGAERSPFYLRPGPEAVAAPLTPAAGCDCCSCSRAPRRAARVIDRKPAGQVKRRGGGRRCPRGPGFAAVTAETPGPGSVALRGDVQPPRPRLLLLRS